MVFAGAGQGQRRVLAVQFHTPKEGSSHPLPCITIGPCCICQHAVPNPGAAVKGSGKRPERRETERLHAQILWLTIVRPARSAQQVGPNDYASRRYGNTSIRWYIRDFAAFLYRGREEVGLRGCRHRGGILVAEVLRFARADSRPCAAKCTVLKRASI